MELAVHCICAFRQTRAR